MDCKNSGWYSCVLGQLIRNHVMYDLCIDALESWYCLCVLKRLGTDRFKAGWCSIFFWSDLLFYFKPTAVLVVKWVAQQSARKGRCFRSPGDREQWGYGEILQAQLSACYYPGSVGLFDERGLVLSLGAFLRSWLSQCAWLLVCRPAV